MVEDFFNKKPSIVLIGNAVHNPALIEKAQTLCNHVFKVQTSDELLNIVYLNYPNIIFGSVSHEDTFYLDAISWIKKLKINTYIVLYFEEKHTLHLKEIMDLKCQRYCYTDSTQASVLTELEESVAMALHDTVYHGFKAYFHAFVEHSIVSKSDLEGNITFINENFTKITGYTKEEILGKNHNILKHPSNDNEIYKDLWDTITKGKVWRERVLNRNKDGSDFWADTIIIPFKDEITGEILEYLAIRRDITQLLIEKKAIMAKQIHADEEMKLSEAKDAFLILFTHELKTPLNAILNFSQYLYKHMPHIDEVPKAKRLYLLDQIYKSATSMLENVTNILDLGKLRNQKLHYNLTLFNVKESILDVIEKHGSLAIEHKRTMLFQSDGSDPFITSDEYRFKQILSNIISNAIKYGHTIVEIFLISDNEKIEVIVQDDGKGIKDKEEVFELYTQSSSGLSSIEKKGTGIGLHFVKLLCEGMGLEYKIEDSLTLGGAKFILTKRLKEQKNV
ncbi:PAS domain-containing sensor histidine kinase [Sulfurospirillum oryzae]|uniref:PAS domain-containing sensor histidine kinase n=1 Tax=Sulfurospirillum oryzae TaxID=2976535 RepID=UPI0021E94797|nr:PAS domain-containing sensor histidine kinase [Sulfurospirillum oryzae]